MKKKTIRVLIGKILVGLLCAACVMVAGCNRKVTYSNAGEVIKEKLYKKYGKEFEVVEVSQKSDVPSGLPPILGELSFYAEMYDKENEDTFGASIKTDRSEFKDDYYRYEMKGKVKDYVYDLLKEVDDIEIEYFNIQTFCEEGNWLGEKDMYKFLGETQTEVILDIKIKKESVDEVTKLGYEIYDLLCENNINPSLTFKFKGKKVYIGGRIIYEEETKEEIIERIKFFLELEKDSNKNSN